MSYINGVPPPPFSGAFCGNRGVKVESPGGGPGLGGLAVSGRNPRLRIETWGTRQVGVGGKKVLAVPVVSSSSGSFGSPALAQDDSFSWMVE